MSRVLIPITDVRKSHVEPSPAWGIDGGGTVFVRCACGLCMGDHTVEPNGDVNPSLHHDESEGGCGWHVVATLEGWQPHG